MTLKYCVYSVITLHIVIFKSYIKRFDISLYARFQTYFSEKRYFKQFMFRDFLDLKATLLIRLSNFDNRLHGKKLKDVHSSMVKYVLFYGYKNQILCKINILTKYLYSNLTISLTNL